MNNSVAVIWYLKECMDTIHEIQIFLTEESARNYLIHSNYDKTELYPKIITGTKIFVENKDGNLILQ